MPQPFSDEMPHDGYDYVKILGRINNERSYKFIKSIYVNHVSNLYGYKVFLPGATGNGDFGETIRHR